MDSLIDPITANPVNFIHIAYLAIAVLGLASVDGNSRVSSLRIVLLLVVLLLGFNLLEETDRSGHTYLISPVFTLGFGPAFYWFCRQLVYGDAPNTQQILLHLSPMLFALPLTQWPQAVIAVGSFSQIIYLSRALILISRYHKVTVLSCSNPSDVAIHWMTWVLASFLLMMLQDLVRLNLQPFASRDWLIPWYFLNTCIYAGLVSFLMVMAIKQPALFDQFGQLEFLADEPPAEQTQSDQQAISLFNEIDRTIRTGDLFKQPRFSLRDLATETGIHEKTLSWTINQGAQKNFSEYINQLRIDSVCAQLTRTKAGNLLDIALTAGFNSKSTFNAAFKKHTGLTPREYCKRSAQEAEIDAGSAGS